MHEAGLGLRMAGDVGRQFLAAFAGAIDDRDVGCARQRQFDRDRPRGAAGAEDRDSLAGSRRHFLE